MAPLFRALVAYLEDSAVFPAPTEKLQFQEPNALFRPQWVSGTRVTFRQNTHTHSIMLS